MKADRLALLPRRPPSEVEWEDLLVRIELMPKAISVLAEETDLADASLQLLMRDLVSRETAVRDFIEKAGAAPGETTADRLQARRSQEDTLDRFMRLRRRNFAMVQRRGIDVWDWEGEMDGRPGATIYQVLTLLAREDVSVLAAVRGASRSGAPAC